VSGSHTLPVPEIPAGGFLPSLVVCSPTFLVVCSHPGGYRCGRENPSREFREVVNYAHRKPAGTEHNRNRTGVDMNTKNVSCASKGFSVSSMSGDGIPFGYAVYTTSRVVNLPGGKMKFVKVDGYGEVKTREQIDARNL